MRVMIVVTHLLGTGHLSRALTLGRAFQDAGHGVTLISGGMPAPHLNSAGVSIVQLPPLRSDGINFARLLDDTDQPAPKSLFEDRKSILRDTLARTQPDVLITELFPFGRRTLRDEFLDLLTCAKDAPKPPLILSSIRDILAPPSKPAKAAFAQDYVDQFYDAILVHSVAALAPLELSWPVTPKLAQKLAYTGFVAPLAPQPHPSRAGQGEILVSAGGGDVGSALFNAAKEAARFDRDHVWRILVGGQNKAQQITSLSTDAPANLKVEAARPDFRQMLNHAAVSISMCGYNTALDVLQTGVPAVFVPFDIGGEVEQGIRAKALEKQSAIDVLRAADLSGANLLDAVKNVLAAPPRPGSTTGFDGAARSVEIVAALLRDRRLH